jgi:hypothetical protein
VDAAGPLSAVSGVAPATLRSDLLVDDAGGHDLRVCYFDSNELVVVEDRVEGVDELIASDPLWRRQTK